jgi:hypothetical protein
VGDERQPGDRAFSVLETVRCLECSAVYAKPARGGTAAANPGCPECGYVGWLPATVTVSEEPQLRRSAVGLRQHLRG